MDLLGLSSPAKRARTDDDAPSGTVGCIGCGVITHTVENCPFADVLKQAQALKIRKPGPISSPSPSPPAEVNNPLQQAEIGLPNQTGMIPGQLILMGKNGQGKGEHRQGKSKGQWQDQSRVWQGKSQDWAADGDRTYVRTQLCTYFKKGTCKWGNNCCYAHSEADLNTPVNQKMETHIGRGGAPLQGNPFGAAHVKLDSINILQYAKVAEETAEWLVQAAAYCTADPNASDLENVVDTAHQAAQRATYLHKLFMEYKPEAGTADTEIVPIRNSVIEAKEKAEAAYLSCDHILKFKTAQASSFRQLMAQEQSNKTGNTSVLKLLAESQDVQVSILSLTCTDAWAQNTSRLAKEGFHPEGVSVTYSKDCEIFSHAHDILQTFCGNQHVKDLTTLQPDIECTEYPEIYEAWKAQGGQYWPMTIAKCKQLKKWGVGFSGRKNGDKTAKLALALSMAGTVNPAKVTRVVEQYPEFGKLLTGGNY